VAGADIRADAFYVVRAGELEAFAQLPPSPSLLDSVAARLAVSRLDAAASVQN
jgi:hypothetical protein